MHSLSFAVLAQRRRGGAHAAAAFAVFAFAIFAIGFAAGVLVRSAALPRPHAATVVHAETAAAGGGMAPAHAAAPTADRRLAYPADVVRVIDGDTFEARVQLWPGLELDTKVRLRNIDAPELHARCADELAKAQAARAALQALLAAGGVIISRVGIDKYGGRIDALVATRDTADVSAALLEGGFTRSYDGRRRLSWC